jgi:hypothetical protein
MLLRLSTLLALTLLSGCGDLTVDVLYFSTWGGEHVRLIVTFSGADLEFDCATGRIDEPVHPVDGHFSLDGVYWPGQGGPIGVDTTVAPRPARYEGVVFRDYMTLTVRLTDTHELLGPFELTGGKSGGVTKCL